jgi:hypothetical protein
MLQWVATGSGARFVGIVHHTDAELEYAYDRQSHIGHLDKALDEATAKGWSIYRYEEGLANHISRAPATDPPKRGGFVRGSDLFFVGLRCLVSLN